MKIKLKVLYIYTDLKLYQAEAKVYFEFAAAAPAGL